MQGQASPAHHWPGLSAQLSLEKAPRIQVAAAPRGGSALAEGLLPTAPWWLVSLVLVPSGGLCVCDRSPELGPDGASCPFGLGPFSHRELWDQPWPPGCPMGG